MLLTTSVPVGSVLATTVWERERIVDAAALPLFIWMGEILFRTRLSEEMFRGLSPWLQWLPGRLVHVNVIGCGIFAAVSGSSAATCATIGKIALPELEKRGYDKGISLGSLAGSGTLGLLIPPSIPMVVYAVTANVSVLQVFLGGFLPGFLVMAYSGYIIIWSLLNPKKIPPRDPPMPFRKKLSEIDQAHSMLAADPGRVLFAGAGLCHRHRMRRLGRRRRSHPGVVERHAQSSELFRKRDERDAPDLHDHVHPGRRGIYDGGHGLYRHSGGAGRVGAGSASDARHARGLSEHHVHHPRLSDRRHLDDRADDGDRAADDHDGGHRPDLVRRSTSSFTSKWRRSPPRSASTCSCCRT